MTVTCDSAAAYVLGALAAAERQEYEAHLGECDDCRRAVADLAGLPGLLARVSPADLADPPPVPDTLVNRLLREVRRSGRRRRALMGLVAAAAVVLAVAGTLVVVKSSDDEPPAVAMTAVVDSPVTATASLASHRWGTEVTMDCRYADDSEWSRPYSLVAVNDRGEERQIATWVVGPSHEALVSGSVPWQPDKIDRIEVRTMSGRTLLRLSP